MYVSTYSYGEYGYNRHIPNHPKRNVAKTASTFVGRPQLRQYDSDPINI